MAKFCPNCGKETDDNAAICLNCGVIVGNTTTNNTNNQNVSKKKKGLPTWAIVLIVVGSVLLVPIILIVLGIIFAYQTFNALEDSYYEEDYYEETTTQYGTIGDTLTTSEFEITLKEALIYSQISGDSYYDDIPDYGKEYLVFFVEVKNIANYESYISDYSFEGSTDGYEVDVTYLFNDVNGYSDLDADLSPGRKVKGYIAFEVDKSWYDFDLSYSDWYTGEEVVFTVLNNDDSV